MIAQELEVSLHMAFVEARQKRHEFITVEHLLLAPAPGALRVEVDDVEVELTAKEFTLLETFLRHPGQVLSREQLLSHVWGYDFDPGSNVVDVYVGYLRRKLGAERFETVRGMGYRLKA